MDEPKPEAGSHRRRIVRGALIAVAVLMVLGVAGIAIGYSWLRQGLPQLDSATDYQPILPTVVVDIHGRVVAEYGEQRRILVSMEEIPKHVADAFIAAEDASFYSHRGVNLVAILRAAQQNLISRRVVQGASTITQQVAKTFFLTPERTVVRKLREIVLAQRLEAELEKDEILYLYLNQIYFGAGAYGVESAANVYFGKSISDVTLAEAAVLAGLPKAPSAYSPYDNPRRARQRQLYVISQLRDNGFITAEEAAALRAEEVAIRRWRNPAHEAGYYAEHLRRHLMSTYGGEVVLTQGLRVEASLDIEQQIAAQESLREGLLALEKRHGYRGPIDKVEAADRGAMLDRLETELRRAEMGGILHYLREEDNGVPLPVTEPPARPMRAMVTEVTREFVEVMVGNEQRAILPLAGARWAQPFDQYTRQVQPVTDLRRVFEVGDVILVEAVDVAAIATVDDAGRERHKEWNDLELPEGHWPVQLVPVPEVQGALVVLDMDTAEVRAMVGGFDFRDSEFNRAVQARRQPGSAFKPVVYTAALEHEFTPATMINDSPDVYEQMAEDSTTVTYWRPRNYDQSFKGPITMREALARSRNVPTLRITQDIGLREIIRMSRRLGITSPLAEDLSLALGSSGVSPLEMTNSYMTIAADGIRRENKTLRRVFDRDGELLDQQVPDWVIEAREPEPEEREQGDEEYYAAERVLDTETSYLATYLMRAVVQSGTGWRARQLGRQAAGKTGTTNNSVDSWFVGYTRDYVAGVWIGYDQPDRNLGPFEPGSVAANPVWVDFMRKAHAGLPVREWETPEGIEYVPIDTKTGLRAGPMTEERISMPFRIGTAPEAPAEDLEERPSDVDMFRLDMGF